MSHSEEVGGLSLGTPEGHQGDDTFVKEKASVKESQVTERIHHARPPSPAFSVFMQCDESMDDPPSFAWEASQSRRIYHARPPSPELSVSMRSDWSMDEHPSFAGEPSQSTSSCSDGPAAVLCAVCPKGAFKSCLTCKASFCKLHVRQHYTAPALQRHRLVEATGDLEQRLCQQHHRELEFYCETDQTPVCALCVIKQHCGHEVAELTEDKKSLMRESGLAPERNVPVPENLALSVKLTSVSVTWTKPAGVDEVSYRVTLSSGGEYLQTINTRSLHCTFSDLEMEKEYSIGVSTVQKTGEQSKPVSKTFRIGESTSTQEGNIQRDMCNTSLKEMAKTKSRLKEDSKGNEHRQTLVLNTTQEYIDKDNAVKKHSYGIKDPRKAGKTILLMGETGSGKSTMTNFMLNYILGVELEDEYRFEIIPDEKKSQTSDITVYEICGQESEAVPFPLTIIDTPGFGDTEGFNKDKEIPKSLEALFKSDKGVQHIDAVCVVVKASTTRLTPTQRYIFESILAVFGKDIEENILVLMTFSQNKMECHALKALKYAEIPHMKNKLLFNNGPSDDAQQRAKRWKMNSKSMGKFISTLSEMETRSLQLTQEVLQERRQLEACVEDYEYQICLTLSKQQELENTHRILEENTEKMEANKDFEFTVTVCETIKVPAENMATNCSNCKKTCHRRCPLAPQKMLFLCDVMKNFQCTICECSYSDHRKEKEEYTAQSKQVQTTHNEIKQKYERALGEKLTAEDMKKRLQAEIKEAEKKAKELLQESHKCVVRLDKIALKPNPLTKEQYLDLLIADENNKPSSGGQYIKNLKERASCLSKALKRQHQAKN